MTKASDNPYPSILVAEQGAAPTTPASGYGRIYCKSDGLYFVGDGGVEIGPLAAATGAAYTEGARVYRNAAQAVTTGTHFPIPFDTEVYDTDGMWEGVTNPTRITCVTPGKYLITGVVAYAADTSQTERRAEIRLNGTTYIAATQGSDFATTLVPALSVTTIYDLAAGNYVELCAYHNKGSNLSVYVTGDCFQVMAVQRIG